MRLHIRTLLINLMLILALLAACSPVEPVPVYITPFPQDPATAGIIPTIAPTLLATRPVYDPGTLVDYAPQSGDHLPAVAAHFNTTVAEILAANPDLPASTTTLTPGEIIKIPIYYKALWGNPFQILPDALFVNGPEQSNFDTHAFVEAQPGWLKNYSAFAGERNRRGADLVDYVAQQYSISPRLLLALIEYQAQGLSAETRPEEKDLYPLGYEDQFHRGLYLQLNWAANILNNGYYNWRMGTLDTITRRDGSIEHPDPWQNAATVALQYYFSDLLPVDEYKIAIYSEGLYKTYTSLFGDPWQNYTEHIPGNLQQPELALPFPLGKAWTYTGGPHTGWGTGEPYAAIDFAPPAAVGGCASSNEYVVAVGDGQIVRSEPALVMLDLDGDGDEHTGWVIMYLHLASNDKIRTGMLVKTGDLIGHPSCEGGSATGTHVHIARKYNGEWIPAYGTLAFNLEGWVADKGLGPYLGTLKKHGRTVEACTCSNPASQIIAGKYE